MDNKLIGLRVTTLFLFVSLTACSSTPSSLPAQQDEPMNITVRPAAAVAKKSTPRFAPNYPERYVVVKGDTLWGIAKKFLKDPWLWPSVWHINQNIRNPHLIFPGDVIVMYVVDGKPYLTLAGKDGMRPTVATKNTVIQKQPEHGLKVVKVSPSSRSSKIHRAITTIPMNAIRPFLDSPRLVTEELLYDAPYIVSSYEDHLISGTGNRVYAQNLENPQKHYNVIRVGKKYIDPETGNILGYEAIYLADAKLLRLEEKGRPATLVLTKAVREVLNNDVLIPSEEGYQMFQFTPRSPEIEVKGQVMAVFNGVSQIGQYMVVVLNRGEEHGLAPGHVLAVMAKGADVRDTQKFFFDGVELPDERAGVMMVFKTYKKMSYALVMEAYRSMHINDRFENP